MARPKNADPAETYEQILCAARALIQDEGVAAVSFRRVAERSQRSVGAISYYFENREELLEACSEANYEWIAERVGTSLQRIQEGTQWRDEVPHFVRELFRVTRENQGLVRLRILSTMRDEAIPKGRLGRRLLPQLERVAQALGGSKAVIDVRLAAHTLELLVQRYGVHTDEECQAIVGSDDLAFSLRCIEQHLVQVSIDTFAAALRDAT